jgi:hypothetical protein
MPGEIEIVLQLIDNMSKQLASVEGKLDSMGKTTGKSKQQFKDANKELANWKNELNKGVKSLTGFNLAAIGVAGAVVGIVQGIRKAINETVEYNFAISDMAAQTHTSTEEMSRLVQIAEDVRIGTGELTTLMKQLQQNGIVPSIENIAQLADEYAALDSAEKQTALLRSKGIRDWQTLGRLLKDGGDAIRANADAVKAGLIVTEESIKQTEDYYKAVDDLNDSWTALVHTLGNKAIPALTQTIELLQGEVKVRSDALRYRGMEVVAAREAAEALDNEAEQTQKVNEETEKLSGNLGFVHAGQLDSAYSAERIAEAQQKAADAFKESYRASEEYRQAQSDLVGDIESVKEAIDAFGESLGKNVADKIDELTSDKSPKFLEALQAIDEVMGTHLAKDEELATAQDELAQQYVDGKIDLEAFKLGLENLKDTYAPFQESVEAATEKLALAREEYQRFLDLPENKRLDIDVYWTIHGQPPSGVPGGGGSSGGGTTPPEGGGTTAPGKTGPPERTLGGSSHEGGGGGTVINQYIYVDDPMAAAQLAAQMVLQALGAAGASKSAGLAYAGK